MDSTLGRSRRSVVDPIAGVGKVERASNGLLDGMSTAL